MSIWKLGKSRILTAGWRPSLTTTSTTATYSAPVREASIRVARERATNIEIKNPQVAEWMGDKLVVGDGPWVVSVRENWVDAEAEIRFDGVGTYVIVEQADGTMKINSHTYAGTGSGTGT